MARSVNGVSEVGSSVSSLEFGENVSPRTFQFTTGPTPEGRLNETVGPLLAFNTSSWGLPVMTAILATPGVNNGGWEQVENEDGIEVFKRKLEGSSLLEFKGTVVLPHNILDVASVVMDVPHSCQWLHECADQHYLHEDLAHQQAWSYFRQSGPIVVADRDVIFKLTVTVDRKTNEVVSAFEDYNNSQNPAVQIPPVPDDVVRMPNIDGEFRL
ncbi:MAG: hypothetical protein Q7S00_07495, partial [bacterium]|nr:hypothetical protein [bacterium]